MLAQAGEDQQPFECTRSKIDLDLLAFELLSSHPVYTRLKDSPEWIELLDASGQSAEDLADD